MHCIPILVRASGKIGMVRAIICSAHAPHGQASDGVIDEWWQQLRKVLSCVEGNVATSLMIDGNARFVVGADGSRKPANRNAEHMVACASDFSLDYTQHVDCKGREVITRRGHRHKGAKLDYVLVPLTWSGAFRTLHWKMP